jgi:hypothetical protein
MATNTSTYTYGTNGNRWWVGLNVTSNLATFGATLNPRGNSTNGYEALPSGDAADDIQFANAAKADAVAGAKPTQISVENIEWYNIRGPYSTKAAANAAIPAIQKANPAPGVAQQVKNANVPVVSPVAGALGAVDSWEQALTNFLNALGQPYLWIRIAKVGVGGVMLIVAVDKITGIGKDVGKVVSKIPPIIPV